MDQAAASKIGEAVASIGARVRYWRESLLSGQALPFEYHNSGGACSHRPSRNAHHPFVNQRGKHYSSAGEGVPRMASPATQGTDFSSDRKVGKKNWGDCGRGTREAHENKMGSLQHQNPSHIAESGIDEETRGMPRVRNCARDGAPTGATSQQPIQGADGRVHSQLEAAKKRTKWQWRFIGTRVGPHRRGAV